jgi:hypothetical protein
LEFSRAASAKTLVFAELLADYRKTSFLDRQIAISREGLIGLCAFIGEPVKPRLTSA